MSALRSRSAAAPRLVPHEPIVLPRASRPPHPWMVLLPVVISAAAFGIVSLRLLWLDRDLVDPHHRPEALCFVLEKSPRFAPPFRIDPGAARLRGRFGTDTPALVAMQEAMHFGPGNVLRQWVQRLGDFDLEVLWLRLPSPAGDAHWLVVGWMEDATLGLCRFRFPGTGPELSADEVRWGDELLDRILQPQYFRRGSVPAVRVKPMPNGSLAGFGPAPSR
jgi:hypothetical protein